MEEISMLIDLNYIKNKSTNLKLLNKALSLLEKKISYNYSAKRLINVLEVCAKTYHLTEEALGCITKIDHYLQFKVEIKDIEDCIKVFDIFKANKNIHKSILSIAFNFINDVYAEKNISLSIENLFRIVTCLKNVIKTNSTVSESIKEAVIDDICLKLKIEHLKNEAYGKILEDLGYVYQSVPKKILNVFLEKLMIDDSLSISYFLASNILINLEIIDTVEMLNDEKIEKLKKKELIEQIKILNTAFPLTCGVNKKLLSHLQIELLT